MDKLIKLLNEYGDINWNKAMIEHQDTYIISKKFGFIWWLFEADKVNYEKGDYYYVPDDAKWIEDVELFNTYESLLIKLALSDNPIQDLCNLLK